MLLEDDRVIYISVCVCVCVHVLVCVINRIFFMNPRARHRSQTPNKLQCAWPKHVAVLIFSFNSVRPETVAVLICPF